MSERLEDFIRNNKREFDELTPPASVWERIELELDKQQAEKQAGKKAADFGWAWRIAATIVVILTVGVLFWQHQEKELSDISNINPQLAKQQEQYATLIAEKRTELKQIEKQDPQLYKEFAAEIRAMDENYEKLKSDLPTSPNQEETVKAMIRNLQIQIRVLNQQLEIIEQVNQFKQQQANETHSI